MQPFSALAGKRVAIANRAEIAIRIARTCRRLGAEPALLIGEPDWNGFAARRIGQVEIIGEAGSELNVSCVVAAAQRVGADLLHPGYGFLSERADLAEACSSAGIRFVGPSAATLRLCGDKLETRAAAVRAGVAVLLASEQLDDLPESWIAAARDIGYPLLVKPAGAGGGRGLRFVGDESDLVNAIHGSRREISSSDSDARIYLERALMEPRHVEVQVVADAECTFVLGDRDCSVQRRHQKVIEEAPAPNIPAETRALLHEYARRVAIETELRGIATCEFLLSGEDQLAFLEVNPRIQVEHPVTELVTGVDLVEWQLTIAAGDSVSSHGPFEPNGHAIEARVYAEDPWNGFFPTPGRLETVTWPVRAGIRIDSGYETGDVVPTEYDSMIAKVIAHGSNRGSAATSLQSALRETIVAGVPTNLPWLLNLLADDAVQNGHATTQTASSVMPTLPDRSSATIAAVANLIDQNASHAVDAWSTIGPWRLSGSPDIRLHGDDWEDRIALNRTADGWVATHEPSKTLARWRRDSAGTWAISAKANTQRFAVLERGDAVEVYGAGGHWLMRFGQKSIAGTAHDRGSKSGRVAAPLPATVLGFHVEVGDAVIVDQPLVTLYAMKMELVCAAPASGVVVAIHCGVNDLVDADQLLVELQLNES